MTQELFSFRSRSNRRVSAPESKHVPHRRAREDIPEKRPDLSAGGYLPYVLIVTTLVAVLPVVAAWALRATGTIASPWVSSALAISLSLAISFLAGFYWRRRPDAGDVLFSDLLVWGWVRRRRLEHQIAQASALLDLEKTDPETVDELSLDRRHQLVKQLAEAFDARDVYLYGHSQRVARHAAMIARQMGLCSEEVAKIRTAAAIHDVGKIHTPTGILNKPGRLTELESEVIKRHPVDGAEIVAALNDRELTGIVRHHHERMDGTGYPDGLVGNQIPLGARIIAVADTFDAITSARPYRTAKPHSCAIEILRKEAGTQLDPSAVTAFHSYYCGNRPVLLWTTLTATLQRAFGSLRGDSAVAATVSAGRVGAAVATVTIGVAAAAIPVLAPVAPSTAGGVSHLAAVHREVASTPGTTVRSSQLAAGTTVAPVTGPRPQIGRRAGNTRRATNHEHLLSTSPVQRVRRASAHHTAIAKSSGSIRALGSGTARGSKASADTSPSSTSPAPSAARNAPGAAGAGGGKTTPPALGAGATHAGSGKPPGTPGRAPAGGGKPPGTPGNGPATGAGKAPSLPVGPQAGAGTPVGLPSHAGKPPSTPGNGPPTGTGVVRAGTGKPPTTDSAAGRGH